MYISQNNIIVLYISIKNLKFIICDMNVTSECIVVKQYNYWSNQNQINKVLHKLTLLMLSVM